MNNEENLNTHQAHGNDVGQAPHILFGSQLEHVMNIVCMDGE